MNIFDKLVSYTDMLIMSVKNELMRTVQDALCAVELGDDEDYTDLMNQAEETGKELSALYDARGMYLHMSRKQKGDTRYE